jgi:hypothetical protein
MKASLKKKVLDLTIFAEQLVTENVSVNLPHTVIFRRGCPLYWYFSDVQGRVMRRKKTNLTTDEVYKGF